MLTRSAEHLEACKDSAAVSTNLRETERSKDMKAAWIISLAVLFGSNAMAWDAKDFKKPTEQELKTFQPRIIMVDGQNRIKE